MNVAGEALDRMLMGHAITAPEPRVEANPVQALISGITRVIPEVVPHDTAVEAEQPIAAGPSGLNGAFVVSRPGVERRRGFLPIPWLPSNYCGASLATGIHDDRPEDAETHSVWLFPDADGLLALADGGPISLAI